MSYNTIYTVPFRSYSETLYTISIEKKGYTGSSHELKGGATPIVVDTETPDLMRPMRLSAATVQVYGSDYLQNLYTPDPQGLRVKLHKGDTLVWVGYVAQDTYSQDFSNPNFIYEIECVCALSTLKYKDFKKDEGIYSFTEYIQAAMAAAGGVYDFTYVHENVTLDGAHIIDRAGVSSTNFFDELDKSMTWYEVLEEIAKYLGLCVTVEGPWIYLLDYLCLKDGKNRYVKIPASGASMVTEFADAKKVQEVGYSGTGSKLSRIPGKNKAKVVSSIYDVNTTIKEFDTKLSTETGSQTATGPRKTFTSILKFYKDENYTFYKYPGAVETSEGSKGAFGSTMVEAVKYKTNAPPVKLDWQTGIYVVRKSGSDTIKPEDPIFKMRTFKKQIYNSSTWFSISFNLTMYHEGIFFDAEKYLKEEADKREFYVYLRGQLRIGDYYYAGNNGPQGAPVWKKEKSYFTVFSYNSHREKEHACYKEFKIKEDNDFRKGVEKLTGRLVKAPDFPLIGECEFTLFSAHLEIKQNGQTHIPVDFNQFFISDFSLRCQAAVKAGGLRQADAIFENEVNLEFVDEAERIELKLSTNTDDRLAHSSVFLDKTKYLGEVNSKAVGVDGIAEELLIRRVIRLYKQARYKLEMPLKEGITPYSLVTDDNLPGAAFVLAGGEIDYKREAHDVILIEA